MGKAAGRPALQFNVKLTEQADRSDAVEGISGFPGVEEVVQTFPEEHDPELSRLYLVKLKPSRAKSALEKLQKHPAVEFVEGVAPRKLIW